MLVYVTIMLYGKCHVPYLYVIRVHEREYMYVYLHVYITRLG